MSHFTVLVIGPDPETQLAPFQENNMGECPPEYMEFEETTEDYRKDFAENNEGHETYADYMVYHHGYQMCADGKKIGYWGNPNQKWDWYKLGGRWTGYFKLKPDANSEFAIKGSAGLMTSSAKDGYADTALKKDIDVAGMIEIARGNAKERYEKVEALFPDGIPKIELTWATICDKEGEYKDMEWDARKNLYHSQESIKIWKKIKHAKADEFNNSSSDGRSFYMWLDQDDYQCTKEEYIQSAGDSALSSYAILKDGKWYERGEMGWWGMASNEKDKDVWDKEFAKLIDELPDNTLFSLYDCHI